MITRCRGPLIWVEDESNLSNVPLLVEIKDKLEQMREREGSSRLHIDFFTKGSDITDDLVTTLFTAPGQDIEEMNQQWESMFRVILMRFKTALNVCINSLRDNKVVSEKDFQNLELSSLNISKILNLSSLPGLDDARRIFDGVLPRALFKMDNNWGSEWNDDVKGLISVASLLPDLTGIVLKLKSIANFCPGVDSTLARSSLRFCTCGSSSRSQSLEPVLFVKGSGTAFESQNTKQDSSGWFVYRVPGTKRIKCRNWSCITDDSFVMVCLNDSNRNLRQQLATHAVTIFKFDEKSDLTVTRASNGWLLFQERTYIAQANTICYSVSVNSGMKCRCRARSGPLTGTALRHAFGPYVCELSGSSLGFASKYRRVKGDTKENVTAVRMPPVGDAAMIKLLADMLNNQSTANSSRAVDLEQLIALGGDHLRSASMIWNNFFGGRFMLMGIESALQPWLAIGRGDPAGMVMFEAVRRCVEGCLLSKYENSTAVEEEKIGRDRSFGEHNGRRVVKNALRSSIFKVHSRFLGLSNRRGGGGGKFGKTYAKTTSISSAVEAGAGGFFPALPASTAIAEQVGTLDSDGDSDEFFDASPERKDGGEIEIGGPMSFQTTVNPPRAQVESLVSKSANVEEKLAGGVARHAAEEESEDDDDDDEDDDDDGPPPLIHTG